VLAMGEQRGFLHVIVHSAWNLPASDVRIVRKPSSDPYCIISMNGRSKNTPTVYENLSPTWEHPLSFQMGSFLPQTLLVLLGARPNLDRGGSQASLVHIAVKDEDLLTEDDPLGDCWLDIAPIFEKPGEWIAQKVILRPPEGITKCGIVSVSLCYEPAPVLSPYLGRISATVCFAAAFACLTIAANSRWQPALTEAGAVKQPGVGVTLVLAAIVMLLATVLHFVLAHSGKSERLDSLAASHSAARGLAQALAHLPCCNSAAALAAQEEPVVRVQVRPTSFKLTSYEMTVTPLMDFLKVIHLPMIMLAGLMPFGGAALCLLAALLQMQDGMLSLQAGEMLATLSVLFISAGVALTVCADMQPRCQQEVMRRSVASRGADVAPNASVQGLHTLSFSGGTSQAVPIIEERERRRDVIWRKVVGSGSHIGSGSHD